MDIKDVRISIQTSFDTAWADETPLAWDNVRYDSINSEFARLTVKFDDGWQASLGGTPNRLFRLSGFVFLQVFADVNENQQRADELSQIAYDYFVTPLAGIRYFNPKIKDIGFEGNYYNQNVVVEFQVDQQK